MTSVEEPPVVLQFKEATFEYDMINNDEDVHATRFRLEKVNMEVKKVNTLLEFQSNKIKGYLKKFQGELVCIEGPVGSGKSSFIAAIVAGINCVDGSICVQDLTSGNVRKNIIFKSHL